MSEKSEPNQAAENVMPEASDGTATNRRPPKRRPQSAPGEGSPEPATGQAIDGQATASTDHADTPAQPPQAPVPPVAEFRGLDEVELPPKSEAEVRELAKAEEMAGVRSVLDVAVKERAVKLNELRRKSRQINLEMERQANVAKAAGIAGAVTGDLRQRGFTLDRVKRILALIARTTLTPDEVGALIARYTVK